jgi:redox-sensing transcriptional repressor
VKNFTEERLLPPPTLERLAHLYTLLSRLEKAGIRRVTSRTLGELLCAAGDTVRKDLSLLGGSGREQLSAVRGYDIPALREVIGSRLGLRTGFSACLAGIGRLGGAILHQAEEDKRYPLAAAFDASMNRIELTRTDVPLYHSAEISRVVREKAITLGIIAVPPGAALDVARRLIEGGVRGIVNFTPVIIPASSVTGRSVIVRNISLTGELDVIAAYMHAQEVTGGVSE